jgi:hypothetical protein
MNNTELARRAVACKHWRWMIGMRTDGGSHIINDAKPISALQHINCTDTDRSTDWLPDLTDSATIGCLLALVRKAWGDPGIYAEGQYSQGRYMYRVRGGHGHGAGFNRATKAWHPTEALALVAAMEAAP